MLPLRFMVLSIVHVSCEENISVLEKEYGARAFAVVVVCVTQQKL